MRIKVGEFEYDGGWGGLFLRVPFVGEAWLGGGMTSFESAKAIRRAREATLTRQRQLDAAAAMAD